MGARFLLSDIHDMLVLWHRRESLWNPVEGYPRECPSTAGYRASRQYDSDNGASESDHTSMVISHVDDVVKAMDEPFQTAIKLFARNRATGASVWRSQRLPQDQQEVAEITQEALEIFSMRV
jgi:hypothetical protein